MKTNKAVGLVAGALLLLVVTSGCVNSGNTDIARNVGPLPFKDGEKSVVKTTTTRTNDQGQVYTRVIETEKTGLAVNEGITHHKLQVAEKVGVARESSSGVVIANSGYGYSGGYSGYGGNYGGGNSAYVTPYGANGGGGYYSSVNGATTHSYGGGGGYSGVNGASVRGYGQ